MPKQFIEKGNIQLNQLLGTEASLAKLNHFLVRELSGFGEQSTESPRPSLPPAETGGDCPGRGQQLPLLLLEWALLFRFPAYCKFPVPCPPQYLLVWIYCHLL